MRAALGLAAVVALGLAAAGCGADFGGNPDGGGGPDGPPGCHVVILFDPSAPIAGPSTTVRADAVVTNAPGVLTYTWEVKRGGIDVPTTMAQIDNSAVTFPADQSGVYNVRVDVGGSANCPTELRTLNVLEPGGGSAMIRVRVLPPAGVAAPPHEQIEQVLGGADFSLGTIVVPRGAIASGRVRAGASGVPAYLRFVPDGAPGTAVEAFASASGDFSVRVRNGAHKVLVIPTSPAFAPRRVTGWQSSSPDLLVSAGDPITGVVRGPGGAPLAGAVVQLKIDDVPSTLATTAANGAFTLLATRVIGATVTVDVAPPPGSGLPRLSAQSAVFDLAQPVQVAYSVLSLRDVAGTTLRRGGTPLPGAKLTLVGTIAAVGTVTAGGAPAAATGTVRIAATAGAGGALPSTLAPARPLAAVVEVAPGDHAVAAVDLTAAAPATIDAPAAIAAATQLRGPNGAALAGVTLDAIPAGPLALAGVTSTRRARSGSTGQAALSLAAGGLYDLRVHDPLLKRGAPRRFPGVAATALAAGYALAPGLIATGTAVLSGTSDPVGGGAVQILCESCTGLDRDLPLAEATADGGGDFIIVAPDPGLE